MNSVAALAKRESGVMSHHKASATATHTVQGSEELSKRHRHRTSLYFKRSSGLLSLLVVLVFVSLSASAAARPHGDRRARSAPLPAVSVEESFLVDESLLVDTQPLAVRPLMPPVHDGDATKTASAPPSKRSLDLDPQSSDADFQLPKPFDSGLSSNLTSTCGDFLNRMLESDTIDTCHPFSLMLLTSTGLWDASRSKIRITQTLEATCAANSTECLGGMNSLAGELTSDSACKVDYDNNNAQVVQAYNGLVAYEPLYRASCLRDKGGNFCYANAVTNTTSAGEDAYPYTLPLGVTLAGGARPTCNPCLQDTMAIFSTFSGNATQPISQTYSSAAQQITIYCGTTFVNVTAAPLKGSAPATSATVTPTITLFIMLFFYFFQ